jgi:hypothetical protein
MRRPYTFDHPAADDPQGRSSRGRLHLRRPRGSAAPLVTLIAFAVIAAACSSSPKSPGVVGEGSPNSTPAAASGGPQSPGALAEMMAYSRCMRGHGIVDFPDPTPNPGGPGGSFSWSGTGKNDDLDPNNARYQAANKACEPLLPDGGQVRAPSAKLLAEEVRMAACMRSRGVPNFPDPDGQGAFELGDVNRSTAQYRAAFTNCQSLTGFKGPMRVGISHQGP